MNDFEGLVKEVKGLKARTLDDIWSILKLYLASQEVWDAEHDAKSVVWHSSEYACPIVRKGQSLFIRTTALSGLTVLKYHNVLKLMHPFIKGQKVIQAGGAFVKVSELYVEKLPADVLEVFNAT